MPNLILFLNIFKVKTFLPVSLSAFILQSASGLQTQWAAVMTNLRLMIEPVTHRCTLVGNTGGGSLGFGPNSFEEWMVIGVVRKSIGSNQNIWD
jgi:hypothetical protein